MPYYIEILVNENSQQVWKKVRPSQRDPYQFDTLEHAEQTAAMCYPDAWRIRESVRIVNE